MAATTRASVAAREHIDQIRRCKFSIGAAEPNPLTEDLHHAVRNLSAELYTKDIHFLMELIQNAEDNEYQPGVNPTLEFVVTSKDITATGVSSTLLVFNNEIGFSRKNIESICSVGRSTKKGKRQEGFIGEKGIGFKSVFLVTSQPYIFSNGYQIRFTEEPDPSCGIGYIVPIWVDAKPTLSDIHRVYGSKKALPTTVLILPLRSEKVHAVKQQLSMIHPELLLFLSKIKRLSVRESNIGTNSAETVTAISISSETDFRTRKDVNADSRTVFLSAQEGADSVGKDCHYYIWRQRFPVKPENRVAARKDVEEWAISLAFPFGERLKSRMSSAGVYAFLPTEMVTKLPFIIQADFILVSSRETIVSDNKWNKGILGCVADAFINAFVASVKSVETAPISSVVPIFKFLPATPSHLSEFNGIRERIKDKLQSEYIIPCESLSGSTVFCQPREVGRLLPAFRSILLQLQDQGLFRRSSLSLGKFMLHSAFDLNQYDDILNFLGIGYVSCDWYGKCIKHSNAILQASEDVYLELLCFLSDYWNNGFSLSFVKDLPTLKYVDQYNKVALCSFQSTRNRTNKILFASNDQVHAWINKWNVELKCLDMIFLPNSTQMALKRFHRKDLVSRHLGNVKFESITMYAYVKSLASSSNIARNPDQVICFTHFLCQSLAKNHITSQDLSKLCPSIPIVDRTGQVIMNRNAVLIPATQSRWVSLLGSNPWTRYHYVELGDLYSRSGQFAGEYTSTEMLQGFVKLHIGTTDIPELLPPDVALSFASIYLSKEQAFLLLDWLRFCIKKGLSRSDNFIRSIEYGSWLKTRSGYKPPNRCFLPDRDMKSLLPQLGNISSHLAIIDEQFYGTEICSYIHELKFVGVKFGSDEALRAIAFSLMSIADFTMLTRESAVPFLEFMKYSWGRYRLSDDALRELKRGIFLKTIQGYKPACESVVLDLDKDPFLQIVELPFLDVAYYGPNIKKYSPQFGVLGAVVNMEQAYKSIVEKCAFSSTIPPLTKEVAISLLKFIRHIKSRYMLNDDLLGILKARLLLKTPWGSASVVSSLLVSDSEAISQITDLFPIDKSYYGADIDSYKNELRLLGVVVDLDQAYPIIAERFRFPRVLSTMTKVGAFLLLRCIRHVGSTAAISSLVSQMARCAWLRTSLGYKIPSECYLPDSQWCCLLHVIEVARIDEPFYGGTIHEFKAELKRIGVIVDFDSCKDKVARRLKQLSLSGNLSKENVLSLLDCCKRLLDTCYSPVQEFRNLLLNVNWIKTSHGYTASAEAILWSPEWERFSQIADLPFINESYYGEDIHYYRKELEMLGIIVNIKDGYNVLISEMKLPKQLSKMTSGYALLLLELIKILNNENLKKLVTSLIKKIKNEPWLKTNLGFKCPAESILSHSDWSCMLRITKVPVINKGFYGNKIQSFKSELLLTGVVVDSASAVKVIAHQLKEASSSFSLTKTNILSMLNCIKCLKGTEHSPVDEFRNCLSSEKWLKTSHGYSNATSSILYDSSWESISHIADLPFIDHVYYSVGIYTYRSELKMMGVVLDLGDGFQLVAKGIKLPEDPSKITSASVLSLLKCIKYLLEASSSMMPEDFLTHVQSKWLRTCMGYRLPKECFLFDSTNPSKKKWASILRKEDAPFIDETFYGSDICLYKNELKFIGVTVDEGEGSSLLAGILLTHAYFPAIKRIYMYLNKFKFKPEPEESSINFIRIPREKYGNGEWVHSSKCVLFDNDYIFGSQLYALDKYYGKSLLPFFSNAFGIRQTPSLEDYLTLWNEWEAKSQHKVTSKKCCAFWGYILGVWNETDTETIKKRIVKLPSKTSTGEIFLANKDQLFIPDDLQLEQMFSEASLEPLFVWGPKPSIISVPLDRLYEIYKAFGARKLSESVQKGADSPILETSFSKVRSKPLIGEGLLILVLAFLADPHFRIYTEERHEIVRPLIDVDVYETKEPIIVSYDLATPWRRKSLSANASKMVSWEKITKRLIVSKPKKCDPKTKVEFAFHFANAVSEGLLWAHTDLIEGLSKLIKLGCVLDFNTDAMGTLLKMENLQVLVEDKEFLASTFSSAHKQPVCSYERASKKQKTKHGEDTSANRIKTVRN